MAAAMRMHQNLGICEESPLLLVATAIPVIGFAIEWQISTQLNEKITQLGKQLANENRLQRATRTRHWELLRNYYIAGTIRDLIGLCILIGAAGSGALAISSYFYACVALYGASIAFHWTRIDEARNAIAKN